MPDPFDQLAAIEVPPLPDELDDQVHQRLNRALLVVHFYDLFLRAMPWSAIRFLTPFAAFFKYTMTGLYERGRSRRR